VTRFVLIFMAAMSLSGCSAFSALTSMLPGSDGVNANVQAGKENTQAAVSVSERIEAGDGAEIESTDADQANRVEGTQIINSETPWWQIGLIALLAGWAIPTPMVMALGIVNFFRIIFGKQPIKP
jgi:hypothetical protein